MIVVPVLFMLIVLAKQSVDAYSGLQELLQLPAFESKLRLMEVRLRYRFSDTIGQCINLQTVNIRSVLLGFLGYVQQFLVSTSTAIVTGFTGFLFNFFITLLTMYFFFVDGNRILEHIESLTPSPRSYAQKLMRQFQEVSVATFYGSTLTALAQEATGAIAFLILGLPSPHSFRSWGRRSFGFLSSSASF